MSNGMKNDSDLNLDQLSRIVQDNLPKSGWVNIGSGYMARTWVECTDDGEIHHEAVLTPFGESYRYIDKFGTNDWDSVILFFDEFSRWE